MLPDFLVRFKENYPFVIQLIGYAGMAFAIFSFTRNSKREINFFQIISGGLFAVHFFLLGQMPGFLLNVLATSRSFVYSRTKSKLMTDKKVNIAFLIVFMILCLGAGIVTWDRQLGFIGFLPAVGMVLSTVGLWIKNPVLIRCISIIASPCWLIYNIFVGSVPGVLTEACAELSILSSAVRYDLIPLLRKKKEEKKSAEE